MSRTRSSPLWPPMAQASTAGVKKMLMAVGHRVLRLHRDAFGPLTLTGVQEGRWRELNEAEVGALEALCTR